MKLFSTLLLIFLLGMVTTQCKKDTQTVNLHLGYYNLTPGRYIIYDVTEISHSQGAAGSDTSIYQLKTVIGEVVVDNSGREARKFYRYTRDTSGEIWTLRDVWTTIIADYRAELIEENQRVVKLVFAPTLEKNWDANAYNPQEKLDCSYDEIHKNYTIGSHHFDSTITVEQADDLNLIEYKRKYEVYANGIGLVKKHFRDLKINNFDVTDINEGKELFMNYVSSGIE